MAATIIPAAKAMVVSFVSMANDPPKVLHVLYPGGAPVGKHFNHPVILTCEAPGCHFGAWRVECRAAQASELRAIPNIG